MDGPGACQEVGPECRRLVRFTAFMLPQALPYQLKVRDYFKQQVSAWEWFAASRTREEQLVSFQTELLKNTLPFRRGTDTALYEKIDLVREKLELGTLPVTAYQVQNADDPEPSAGIVYLRREAHLVFSGPILERLNEAELLAVITSLVKIATGSGRRLLRAIRW